MKKRKERVVVGLSGGVDSSVAALLLQKQGYEVVALFMKNWDDEDPHCPAASDYEDVSAVCHQLNIPYYAVNFSKEYWDEVFTKCLAEYRAGYTPNPDILCNSEIKFAHFLQKALDLDADYMATGHYCQKGVGEHGEWRLMRGADPKKDQTYFLHAVPTEAFTKVLFPVGHLHKGEVRKIAEEAGLHTAHKKDSTGICFIGKRNFKDFLGAYIPRQPGDMKTLSGQWVGRHEGIAFYTIGQRKGLHIGGEGEAWYVVGKDQTQNVLYVEQGDDHPALFQKELKVRALNWIGWSPPLPYRCTAKIRYRSPDAPCLIIEDSCSGSVRVVFDEPQKAVTPMQSIVFYQDKICLGGGIIHPSPCP